MLFTFPSRYWFTIGLLGVFSLSGWSRRFHAGFLVTRATQEDGRLHKAARTQLSCSTALLSRGVPLALILSMVPFLLPRRGRNPDGLGCSPLARHYWGNHVLFSFPAGNKMFQFPALASPAMRGCPFFKRTGCPIRRSPDQRLCAPPRSFSQLITSFVASKSLGIRHAPFPTFSPLFAEE